LATNGSRLGQGELLIVGSEVDPEAVTEPRTENSTLTAAQIRVLNAAHVEGAWRPLVGHVPGQRAVFISDLKSVKVYAEVDLAAAASPVPTARATLGVGVFSAAPVFDYDGDGTADIMVLDSTATGTSCDDGKNVLSRSVAILSGKNQLTAVFKSGGIPDLCVPVNGGATALVQGVHAGALQYGPRAGAFSLVPQYYANGWFGLGSTAPHFFTPSGENFASYSAAKPMLQPSAGGLSYQYGGQPLNGLVLEFNGALKYVATTSGRFLEYALSAYSGAQLLKDAPFLARADLVGRNYGLIQHDKGGNQSQVFLIAGAGANDLFADFKKSNTSGVVNGTDVWAGIERHVSNFNLSTGAVVQKFYGYAHDNTNGETYRNRVTYPSFARLPSTDARGSRMIYNVFDGANWSIHISVPGGVASQSILANYYVWDVIPVDVDTVDIVVSPTDTSRKIWIPNFVTATGQPGSWRQESYFPQMKTEILRWKRSDEFATVRQTIANGIPYLEAAFPHSGSEANGTGYLFPTLRTRDSATKSKVVMIMFNAAGATFEALLEP